MVVGSPTHDPTGSLALKGVGTAPGPTERRHATACPSQARCMVFRALRFPLGFRDMRCRVTPGPVFYHTLLPPLFFHAFCIGLVSLLHRCPRMHAFPQVFINVHRILIEFPGIPIDFHRIPIDFHRIPIDIHRLPMDVHRLPSDFHKIS